MKNQMPKELYNQLLNEKKDAVIESVKELFNFGGLSSPMKFLQECLRSVSESLIYEEGDEDIKKSDEVCFDKTRVTYLSDTLCEIGIFMVALTELYENSENLTGFIEINK